MAVVKDPRIDAYIEKQNPESKKVLTHLRKLIHRVCPKVEETIKWGAPAFNYHGPLINMAGFKQHSALVFFKAELMQEHQSFSAKQKEAMGHLGRITDLRSLPPDDTLKSYIHEAMLLNEKGVKLPPRKKSTPVETPEDLLHALSKNKKAFSMYEKFPPSHRKAYVEWIVEAKQETTRNKRIEQAVAWMAEGKGRNWKYEQKK